MSGRDRIAGLSPGALLGALGVLGLLGVVVGVLTRPDTHVVVDGFDEAFGRASTGQTWDVQAGDWEARNGELSVTGDEPALTTIDPGRANGELTAQVPTSVHGSGIVFRYVDRDHYWRVVADEELPGWRVDRIAEGSRQQTRDLWKAPSEDAAVRVVMNGPRVTIAVGDVPAVEMFDPAAEKGTGIGVIADGDDERARWDEIRFAPAGDPVVQTSPTEVSESFLRDGRLTGLARGPAWLVPAGDWIVEDGVVRPRADRPGLAIIAVGATDLRLSAQLDSGGLPGVGIVARYSSDGDHLRLVADPQSSRWVLQSVRDSEVTDLASVPGEPAAHAVLTLDGETATVQVGSERVVGVPVPQPEPGAVYAGLVSPSVERGRPGFDQFDAQPLEPPAGREA